MGSKRNQALDGVIKQKESIKLNFLEESMATRTIAGKAVQVNEEGFMTNPNEWTKEMAVELAVEEGIGELSAAHWKVIEFCRQSGIASGKAPTLRTITSGAGVTTKEMFALFPKGPAKKVARISGLGKPEGCV
jgi:dissimilatory sulfite reductase related protein